MCTFCFISTRRIHISRELPCLLTPLRCLYGEVDQSGTRAMTRWASRGVVLLWNVDHVKNSSVPCRPSRRHTTSTPNHPTDRPACVHPPQCWWLVKCGCGKPVERFVYTARYLWVQEQFGTMTAWGPLGIGQLWFNWHAQKTRVCFRQARD